MVWEIYIAGELTSAELVKIDQRLNKHEEAIIRLERSPDIVDLVSSNQDVDIYFSETKLFSGKLMAAKFKFDHIECTCYLEAHDKLKCSTITKTYTAATPNTIVNDICIAAGLTFGSAPTTPTISVRFDKAICWDALRFVCDTIDKDFWVDGLTLYVGDKGVSVGLVEPSDISRRAIDRSKVRNKVIVRGVDTNGNVIYGEASYGAGDRIVVFTEKKASDTATLNSLAQKYLNEFLKETSGVNFKVFADVGVSLNTGDTVTLDEPELNLAGLFRIYRLIRRPDKTEVEVDKPEIVLEDIFDDMRQLEDIGIYPVSLGQLDNPPGAPAIPSGLSATATLKGIFLTWTANTEADLRRYRVYRDTVSPAATEIAQVDSNAYLDEDVTYGTTYYYRIKAEDNAGNFSDFSSEVSASPLKVDKTDTTDLIAVTDGTRSAKVYLTTDKDLLDPVAYEGVYVYDTGEDLSYYSDGVQWVPTDVSKAWDDTYAPDRQVTFQPAALAWYGTGVDGDVVITTDTDLGDNSLKFYNNLTVDTGITLSGNSPMYIFVKETLTLNGTIKVNTVKGGGAGGTVAYAGDGGDGGRGGGILFICAKAITGSGTIQANGANGKHGKDGVSTPGNTIGESGDSGEGAELQGTIYTGANGGVVSGSGSAGGGGGSAGEAFPATNFKRYRIDILNDYDIFNLSTTRFGLGGGGGGGASGAGRDTLDRYGIGGGGGGGGSCVGKGGKGGDGGDYTSIRDSSGGGGGGGGGAGGIIILLSEASSSTMTLEARGGNGGNGGDGSSAITGSGGGGGAGGGGGFILTFCDVSPLTDVSGGSGGAGGLGVGTYASDGLAGANGSAGFSLNFGIEGFRRLIRYTP